MRFVRASSKREPTPRPPWAVLGWAVGLLCLCVSSVAAHEKAPTTHLVLQVGEAESEMLVLYEVPGGEEAAGLRAFHDVSRDGHLSSPERKALAARMAQKALYAIQVRRDGEAVAATDVDWRLEAGDTPDDPILLAVMVTLDGGVGRYSLSLEDPRPAVQVELEAGEGMTLEEGIAAPSRDGIALGPLVLSHGDTIWAEIAAQEDAETP